MLKYRIEVKNKKNPVPVAVMEEERYDLAGEFLLAEARNFGAEILAALDQAVLRKKSGSFSGNVFSLETGTEITRIADDISDRICEVPTEEFRQMAMEYCQEYERLLAR